jgi:hypothetical protein
VFRRHRPHHALRSAGELLLCECGDGRVDPCCDPDAHGDREVQPLRVVEPSAFIISTAGPV